MRKSVIAVIAAGLLYSGYWAAGTAAVGTGIVGYFDGLRQQGWDVSYDRIENRGFPARFDLTLIKPDLRSADGTVGWQAPFVQIDAASYLPTAVNIALPDSQTLTLPDQQLTISSTGLQAKASVAAQTALPLDAITAYGGDIQVQSDAGWQMSLALMTVVFRAVEPGGPDYAVLATMTDLGPPAALIGLIDPEATLPSVIELLQLDATIRFDRPLDRFAGDTLGDIAGPAVRILDLRQARIVWGDIEISASGALTIDPTGSATGLITITAQNWRQMIEMAVNAGLLAPGAAPTWDAMGSAMAQRSDQLTAPIRFDNGLMSIGPIPLGPAPQF